MKVLLISHAMRVPTTWTKSKLIGAQIELLTVVPDKWPGYVAEDQNYPSGFKAEKCMLPGRNHFHFYPNIGGLLRLYKPDLVHIDEEPYSLVTFLVGRRCRQLGIPFISFTWQNIFKIYPFIFRRTEAAVLRWAGALICGNPESERVFRRKGFLGKTFIIPQFGVDEDAFKNCNRHERKSGLSIIYVGRLVKEKGCDLIISALESLPNARLSLVGTGPDLARLKALSQRAGLCDRISFQMGLPAREVSAVISAHDVLVLPSRTMPNWKEQFGRVLVEAMATGTPVIGSSSGEIPSVIGDAGVTFTEESVIDLRVKIHNLMDRSERLRLGARGILRAREFTQHVVATRTIEAYEQVLNNKRA